jgi:hypothetical protein
MKTALLTLILYCDLPRAISYLVLSHSFNLFFGGVPEADRFESIEQITVNVIAFLLFSLPVLCVSFLTHFVVRKAD